MKGLPRFVAFGLLACAALASPVVAQNPPAAGRGQGLRGIRRCLFQLDLDADQKASIQALVSDARTGLQSDVQALRADHQKLRADIAAGVEACALGQDVLTQHADALKLKKDVQALKDQVLSKLTADQQTALTGCLQSSRAARHWGGPAGGL